jgi:hypothetical protein
LRISELLGDEWREEANIKKLLDTLSPPKPASFDTVIIFDSFSSTYKVDMDGWQPMATS